MGRNDSSLLSSDSLNLLRTTLHNWGHTIRNLGSANVSNDDDDDDNESENKSESESEKDAAKAGNGKQGEGEKDVAAADDAAAGTLQV